MFVDATRSTTERPLPNPIYGTEIIARLNFTRVKRRCGHSPSQIESDLCIDPYLGYCSHLPQHHNSPFVSRFAGSPPKRIPSSYFLFSSSLRSPRFAFSSSCGRVTFNLPVFTYLLQGQACKNTQILELLTNNRTLPSLSVMSLHTST